MPDSSECFRWRLRDALAWLRIRGYPWYRRWAFAMRWILTGGRSVSVGRVMFSFSNQPQPAAPLQWEIVGAETPKPLVSVSVDVPPTLSLFKPTSITMVCPYCSASRTLTVAPGTFKNSVCPTCNSLNTVDGRN